MNQTHPGLSGNRETMKNLVTSIFLDFDELEEFNFRLQRKYSEIEEKEVRYEEYLLMMQREPTYPPVYAAGSPRPQLTLQGQRV